MPAVRKLERAGGDCLLDYMNKDCTLVSSAGGCRECESVSVRF